MAPGAVGRMGNEIEPRLPRRSACNSLGRMGRSAKALTHGFPHAKAQLQQALTLSVGRMGRESNTLSYRGREKDMEEREKERYI